MFQTSFPDRPIGAGLLVLNQTSLFPEQENLNWKDMTYRSAASWDVPRHRRTAFKVTLNKYLQGQRENMLAMD